MENEISELEIIENIEPIQEQSAESILSEINAEPVKKKRGRKPGQKNQKTESETSEKTESENINQSRFVIANSIVTMQDSILESIDQNAKLTKEEKELLITSWDSYLAYIGLTGLNPLTQLLLANAFILLPRIQYIKKMSFFEKIKGKFNKK